MATVTVKKEFDPILMAKFIERSIKANNPDNEDGNSEEQKENKVISDILLQMNLNSKDLATVRDNISKVIGREIVMHNKIKKNAIVDIGNSSYWVCNIQNLNDIVVRGVHDNAAIVVSLDQYHPTIVSDDKVIEYWKQRFSNKAGLSDAFEDN